MQTFSRANSFYWEKEKGRIVTRRKWKAFLSAKWHVKNPKEEKKKKKVAYRFCGCLFIDTWMQFNMTHSAIILVPYPYESQKSG